MFFRNPLISQDGYTPNQSFHSHPLLSSTPFHGRGAENTLQETTAFTLAKLSETSTSLRVYPVDMIIKNPLFGSGLTFEKVSTIKCFYATKAHVSPPPNL